MTRSGAPFAIAASRVVSSRWMPILAAASASAVSFSPPSPAQVGVIPRVEMRSPILAAAWSAPLLLPRTLVRQPGCRHLPGSLLLSPKPLACCHRGVHLHPERWFQTMVSARHQLSEGLWRKTRSQAKSWPVQQHPHRPQFRKSEQIWTYRISFTADGTHRPDSAWSGSERLSNLQPIVLNWAPSP